MVRVKSNEGWWDWRSSSRVQLRVRPKQALCQQVQQVNCNVGCGVGREQLAESLFSLLVGEKEGNDAGRCC